MGVVKELFQEPHSCMIHMEWSKKPQWTSEEDLGKKSKRRVKTLLAVKRENCAIINIMDVDMFSGLKGVVLYTRGVVLYTRGVVLFCLCGHHCSSAHCGNLVPHVDDMFCICSPVMGRTM